MKILGIESSCDESSVALFDSESGTLEQLIHSQIDLHALYGGVVPDLASREHLKKLPRLIEKISKHEAFSQIDEIAVTSGPGLPNCLALGISCASAVSLASQKPLFGINHLRGHAFSPFIATHAQDPKNFSENFKKLLPHLGLIVSGGNTILFEISEKMEIKILAETLDDAAGEALDKGAKLLGIAYPGGAKMEIFAKFGDDGKIDFPYGQNRKIETDPNFSFSGLKTSLRYYLQKISPEQISLETRDICASYQFAVVEQLRRRTLFFAKKGKYKSLGLSGGVSNNKVCSAAMEEIAQRAHCEFLIAKPENRGDNAAMIAFACFADPMGRRAAENGTLKADASWELA